MTDGVQEAIEGCMKQFHVTFHTNRLRKKLVHIVSTF